MKNTVIETILGLMFWIVFLFICGTAEAEMFGLTFLGLIGLFGIVLIFNKLEEKTIVK